MNLTAVLITLTGDEMALAESIGKARQRRAEADKKPNRYGAKPEDALRLHIHGAGGEVAVAKHYGIPYDGGAPGDYGGDDVGPLQVRTRSKHWHELMLHNADKDNRPYIHVTGVGPTFRLRGWIMGRDGKNRLYWSDPSEQNRWAYFVPYGVLRPMQDLYV